MSDFKSDIPERIAVMRQNEALTKPGLDFLRASAVAEYSYNYHWMDRPIIQYPQDIVAMQELIWEIKPDLIVEMGIAHGGSLIFSASMLALMDMEEAIQEGKTLDPAKSKRKVLGVDVDIRAHNRAAIDAHSMRSRIEMIEGSSIDPEIIARVQEFAKDYSRILVCLDSNHTHDHVRAELEAYAPLTSVGSYCVVFDTLIEDMAEDTYPDRPWGKGDNPKTAVWDYLKSHPEFEIDKDIPDKLQITVAHDGFLKRVS
ncbi:cephalosporin hydroxylase family protein [Falsiruegeria mediterranea]|jgi:cephalosporin hydroxylase|uniref:Rhamnosyl O-methyltransferase n=1 Tax=Falsiruegeria mediterranea M17 TaxID=1200281 RepID=A0A2R8CBF7_9RHOB|nr:cephalosporin hydroxylase family protein [Falsiruegeria mediterranea]SPJ29777.1 Rhamnosyl O-methyltransferase [Falsiruegeria mediterranea M17]